MKKKTNHWFGFGFANQALKIKSNYFFNEDQQK